MEEYSGTVLLGHASMPAVREVESTSHGYYKGSIIRRWSWRATKDFFQLLFQPRWVSI